MLEIGALACLTRFGEAGVVGSPSSASAPLPPSKAPQSAAARQHLRGPSALGPCSFGTIVLVAKRRSLPRNEPPHLGRLLKLQRPVPLRNTDTLTE